MVGSEWIDSPSSSCKRKNLDFQIFQTLNLHKQKIGLIDKLIYHPAVNLCSKGRPRSEFLLMHQFGNHFSSYYTDSNEEARFN